MNAPIAIVGMGCRFPGSADLNSYWRTIREGQIHVREVPAERWKHESFYDANPRMNDKTYAKKLATIDDIYSFSPEFFGLLPRRARLMDPQQRIFLDVARTALEDAGYGRNFPLRSTGVFLGISVSEHHQYASMRLNAWQMRDGNFGRVPPGLEAIWDTVLENAAPVQGYSMIGQMLNMAAANVAQSFDLRGPCYAVDAACSSSLVALGSAVLNLRTNQCDAALVGGVYLAVKPDNMVAFSRIGAISLKDVCRPFDDRADGFVLGEGAGALVLKRLDDAQRDGDRIWAVIRGVAINADGRAEGPMTPRKEGQLDVLSRAYDDAGLTPDQIQLVEAHGTGTRVGDATEASSLVEWIEKRARGPVNMRIGAVKANIGHTIAAAGVAGVIKSALALSHGVIPPLAGYERPRKFGFEGHGISIPTRAESWPETDCRRASVSSFGFGGTNVLALLEQAPDKSAARFFVPHSASETLPELFVLSAPKPELVRQYARLLLEALRESPPLSLADIAYTLGRRKSHVARAAFVAANHEELYARLEALGSGADGPGIWIGSTPAEKLRTAFLFPGQGAQALDLGRDLFARFPRFRAAMERLCGRLDGTQGRSILDVLYPPDSASREEADRVLTATDTCQPALAAFELALADLARAVGLEPDISIGHSLGEFIAAASAGVLDELSTVELCAARGRFMAALRLDDPGTMVAVAADERAVAPLIDGVAGVVIANLNHPQQVVLSGTKPGIEAAVARLEQAGLRISRLQVSHAFHSPLLQPVDETFGTYLEAVDCVAPSRTLISCTNATPYPAEPGQIRDLWRRHTTAPVNFTAAVRAAWQSGARVFVECGSGGRLISMVRQVLRADGAAPALAVALTSEDKERGGAFLAALGQLFAAGQDLNFDVLYESRDVRLCVLPPGLLPTQHFWMLRAPRTQAPLPDFTRTGVKSVPAPSAAHGNDFGARLERLSEELSSLTQAYQQGGAPPSRLSTPIQVEERKAPPAPVATPAVTSVVLDAISRVTAIPAADLQPRARLQSDLGFDSLMGVELTASLLEALPGIGELPPTLLSQDPSIEELCEVLASTVALSAGRETSQSTESLSAGVWAAVWQDRARASAVGDPLPPGDVLLVADNRGVADALAARWNAGNRRVFVTSADSQPSGDGIGLIVDLQLLGRAGSDLSSSAIYRSLRGVHRWARLAGNRRAGYVLVAPPHEAGLGGLVRTLSREWQPRLVKGIEILGEFSTAALAKELEQELMSSARDVEVRLRAGTPPTRQVATVEAIDLPAPSNLDGRVVLITGATSGIGRKLSRTLAERPGIRLALFGRRPASEAETFCDELRALGARAHYQSLDVRDDEALARAVDTARDALGPIEFVIHSAGVTADGAFEDAEEDDGTASLVFDTKVAGTLNLWRALATDPLQGMVVLGSWAGRFGNANQAGYAVANRTMAQIAERLAADRPAVRVACLDMPPWEGSGMIERLPEAVKKNLRGSVRFLDDARGLPLILNELGAPADRPSQLVLSVGTPPEERIDETSLQICATDPVVDHHRLLGVPVLPMAAALDIAIAAARRVGVAGSAHAPTVVRDFEVVHGAALQGPTGRLIVRAVRDDGRAAGEARIEIHFVEDASKRPVLAFRGRVATESMPPARLAVPSHGDAPGSSVEDFYRRHTFHGPALRGVRTVQHISDAHIEGIVANDSSSPVASSELDVVVLDSALQLCGFWAREKKAQGALPRRIGRCVVLGPLSAGIDYRCSAVLGSVDAETLSGSLEIAAPNGQPLVVLENIVANLSESTGQTGASPEQVSPDTYLVEQFPEVKELRLRIQMAAAVGLANPYFHVQEKIKNETSVIAGKEYINFASYNYLGLSGDPDVNAAAARAVERFGTSVSASRVASGERPLHRELEAAVAEFLGCEDAIVMVGGHATNVSVIGHLFGPDDIIVHDSLAHDSILGGAKLSGARRRPFAHNDVAALERVLEQVRPHARRVLIAVEGVYSMDGDLAPLPAIVELKKKYKALLLVDEAHSMGVLGDTGRGIGEHFATRRSDVDLWMGTLSKSFASCGGYIAGSKALVEFLKYTTPGFVYSVGISPANAAAALAALHKLEQEPERVTILRERSDLLLSLFRERGIDTGLADGSAVVPCIVKSSVDCLKLSERLKARGINVQPILYPAVEENLARLRFFVTANHSEEQLLMTADAVREELLAINPKILSTSAQSWAEKERKAL